MTQRRGAIDCVALGLPQRCLSNSMHGICYEGTPVKVITTISDLRKELRGCPSTALVPTMGGLHEGHISLVKLANNQGMPVLASLFVNRLQFGRHEDFDTYPRTLEGDLELLEKAGASMVFTPLEREIYPERQDFFIRPSDRLSKTLEGYFRPDFFGGVATVVMKLFACVQPQVAVFGKKDYQQLLIIRSMVKQFCLPISIIAGQTVRAEDGLALSSRNVYLTPEERREAPALHRLIKRTAHEIGKGNRNFAHLEQLAIAELESRGWGAEYVAVRRATDLNLPESIEDMEQPLVVLAAAKLGKTRLLDNVEVR